MTEEGLPLLRKKKKQHTGLTKFIKWGFPYSPLNAHCPYAHRFHTAFCGIWKIKAKLAPLH